MILPSLSLQVAFRGEGGDCDGGSKHAHRVIQGAHRPPLRCIKASSFIAPICLSSSRITLFNHLFLKYSLLSSFSRKSIFPRTTFVQTQSHRHNAVHSLRCSGPRCHRLCSSSLRPLRWWCWQRQRCWKQGQHQRPLPRP